MAPYNELHLDTHSISDNMLRWFSQDVASRQTQLQDDDEDESPDHDHRSTNRNAAEANCKEIPSTHLPTLFAGTTSRLVSVGLTKSLSYASVDKSKTIVKEQQNMLIKSWAIILHLYTVSDAVAFVVIGNDDAQGYTTPAPSMQLVVSHWSPNSTSSAHPRWSACSYNPSEHRDMVNTVVSFTNSQQYSSDFSYTLHWSFEGAANLELYTNISLVPHKFASSLWSTFLEVNSKVRSTGAVELQASLISKTDQKLIVSSVLTPLFEERLCLHQLFQESARLVPDATAVQAWDGSLSYVELDLLSDEVAHELLQKGVRVGQYVPFSFEKSVWMVVAMLAILKAGGALVPIDPSQPQARAEKIVNTARATLAVVSPSQTSTFAKIVGTVLSISPDMIQNSRSRHSKALPQVQPHDPAIMLFTSGSTGTPKGIVVEHSAVSTRMIAEGRAFQYHGARTLQFAASTWDIFMTDVFTTLAFQGCICIPNEEERKFGLARFCKEYDVSLALITPSLASLLEPNMFPTIKSLIFGGEALRENIVQKWIAVEGLVLSQGYGPAETGPCITGRVADRPDILGYALENSVCILVDPRNPHRLVPMGAVGELVVGGPSLLREYLDEPDKTDAAVIEDPPWSFDLDLSVKRYYKTGDLLRYSIDTLDGRLEFVGRTDNQIKYHGQRIELTEIEHHLNKLPGVVACMVTLARKGHYKDRLLAVIQCDSSSSPHNRNGQLSMRLDTTMTVSKMRDFLSTRIPEYMIPNDLVEVDTIPHNPSMKLDRGLVNNWVSSLPNVDLRLRSPVHAHSERLLDDESTALMIAKEYALIVAGDDDSHRRTFEGRDFNLQSGGIDSIQIMSLSLALTKLFDIQVPIADLLSSKSTVRTLASIIDVRLVRHHEHDRPRLREDDREDDEEIKRRLNSVAPSAPEVDSQSQISRVFLTGSSGYLGIEILRQLLDRTNCYVYALMRGSSRSDAERRLVEKARVAGWWKPTFMSRLHVWHGDLAEHQLGLNESQWQMLQGQVPLSIDAIIHNGAKVHYHVDYESLKAANVTSTSELLRAVNAREQPLRSFVFISGGQQLSFDDRDDSKNTAKALRASGYSRSKAESELMVEAFAEKQVHKAQYIRVIKPGFIIGDSKRGLANPKDFIWRLIAASVEMGHYDDSETDGWLYLSDVTRLSHIILQSVFSENFKSVTKMLDGMRFRDLWAILRMKFGYVLHPLSREEWLYRLRQAVAIRKEKHIMFPLMYMFDAADFSIGALGGPPHATTGAQAAMEANIAQLIKTGTLPKQTFLSSNPVMRNDISPLCHDAIDTQKVREHFPALSDGVVAFNNAAGTAVYDGAINGTQKYMSSIPIELGRDDPRSHEKTQQLEASYKELAAFMNASYDEVAFGQTTTFLLRSLGQALRPLLNADCEMVCSNLCHEASAAAWIQMAKDLGIAIKWWAPPPGDDPCLSLDSLKPLLTAKTRIVTCNHVSNVVGTIHPIRKIADMVHTIPGAILIVDGVAWAPHRPIDVQALGVDFYCFSWYKVFGPHIAQLYGRSSVQKRMLTGISHYFLSEMPGLDWRLRLGTNTFELEAALVPIVRYLKDVGWDKIIAQETVLQDVFLAYLRLRPRVFRIFGEKSSDPDKRVAVITFRVIGKSSTEITNSVCKRGRFRVISGNCWAPRPTHDVLGLDQEGLIRVSFVHYNTVSEVHEFCKEIDLVLGALR